jgi:1,4-dihydroxy-2-naphthoyl-CoA hydrolase
MSDASYAEGLGLNSPDSTGFVSSMGLMFDSVTGTQVLAHLDATEAHHTPWGIVHGGVYASIIESVASIGGSLAVRDLGQFAVGVNNQTDFLRQHRTGRLDVVANAIHQGRAMQLWLVDIANDQGKTVARGQLRLFNQSAERNA